MCGFAPLDGNQQTQFFDKTGTLEQYIPVSRSLSVIRLQCLNVKFQRLDSKYFSRSISNLSQIARMTLARLKRLSFVRPNHRLETRLKRITYNFSERSYYL